MLSKSHNLGNIHGLVDRIYIQMIMYLKERPQNLNKPYIFFIYYKKNYTILFMPHQHFYICPSNISAYFFHIEKEHKL